MRIEIEIMFDINVRHLYLGQLNACGSIDHKIFLGVFTAFEVEVTLGIDEADKFLPIIALVSRENKLGGAEIGVADREVCDRGVGYEKARDLVFD